MKRITTIFVLVCLLMSLCACLGSTHKTADAPTPAEMTTVPEIKEADAEEIKNTVNIMVLNGTTGFGMAKLINDAIAAETTLSYDFSVESDASAVTAALINGTCDIAALPTNAAATVYNKTQGDIQILAINTLGVLYLVVNGENVTIESLDDLSGKTVYVPAQNPTFLFKAILTAAGLENVTVDNTYAQPADLRTALAAGEIDIAVLPEPMVTIACAANDNLIKALDLTAEWDTLYPVGSLVQGCVVARTEYAEAYPEAIEAFLEEYEASIAYLTEDAAAAGSLIEETGVFTNGAVAAKAIPNCNICFLSGEEMKSAMSRFCDILFSLEPAAIGGTIPGEDFYWLGK